MSMFDVPALVFQVGADATDFNRKMDAVVAKMVSTVARVTGIQKAMSVGDSMWKGLRFAADWTKAVAGGLKSDLTPAFERMVARARFAGDYVKAIAGGMHDSLRDAGQSLSRNPQQLGKIYSNIIVPASAIGQRIVAGISAAAGPAQAAFQRVTGGLSTAVNSSFVQGLAAGARRAAPAVLSGMQAAAGLAGRSAQGLGMGAAAAGRGALSIGGSVLGRMFDAATSVPAMLGAAALIAGITAALVSGARAAVEYAAEFERVGTSFEVMTGSADKGRQLMEQITQLSLGTPFKASELFDTAKQLKAFGVETSNIIPVLKSLGNVSAGTGTDIGRIALAYGQVMTAGRLMGPELRQFTDAGVPMIENLAAVMNKPKQAIKGLVEQGEVSAGMVTAAFNRMNAEGGVFANMMEKHSQTVAGRWATMTGSIQIALRNLGLSFFRGFDLGNLIKEWTGSIQELGGETGKLDGFFRKMRDLFDIAMAVGQAIGGLVKDAIGTLIERSTAMAPTWKEFKEAAKETLLTIATGIGEVIEGLKQMVRGWMDVAKAADTASNFSGSAFKGAKPEEQTGFYSRARAEGYGKLGAGLAFLGGNAIDLLTGERMSQRLIETGRMKDPGNKPEESIGKMLEEATRPGDPNFLRTRLAKQFDLMEKAQTERARQQFAPLAGLMTGPFANIANTANGIGKSAELIHRNLEMGAKATELFNYIQGEMLKGTTSQERFNRKMALIDEAAFGPGGQALAGGVGGAAAFAANKLAAMNPAQRQFAVFQGFQELERELGHTLEIKLPQAMMKGTAEAQDVINRSNLQQPDREAQVRNILEQSKLLHEQMVDWQRKTVEALDKINAKPVAVKKGI